jgi:hypothetical protein
MYTYIHIQTYIYICTYTCIFIYIGLKEFVTDKEKLANVAGTLTLIALGVYATKNGTAVTARYIEARLGKPSLVRYIRIYMYVCMYVYLCIYYIYKHI